MPLCLLIGAGGPAELRCEGGGRVEDGPRDDEVVVAHDEERDDEHAVPETCRGRSSQHCQHQSVTSSHVRGSTAPLTFNLACIGNVPAPLEPTLPVGQGFFFRSVTVTGKSGGTSPKVRGPVKLRSHLE